MEIVFMPECQIPAEVRQFDEIISSFFDRLVEQFDLDSLSKIVVAGWDSDSYNVALQQHGSEIDNSINVTNSDGLAGAAVVIHGIQPNGNLKQVIFLKDQIYSVFVMNVISLLPAEERPDGMGIQRSGLAIVFHELGHAIEYQTSYRNYGYTTPDKVFNLLYDYNEYVFHESLQLWSEYYAECIAEGVVPQMDHDGLRCLEEYLDKTRYPVGLNMQLNHSYRVAYFFLLYLASLHQHGKSFSPGEFLEQHPALAGYEGVFQELDKVLSDLFLKRGQWEFEEDTQRLVTAYKQLIDYEASRYLGYFS